MHSVFLENGRDGQPVFVKLRRQFHEIARNGSAGNGGPGHIRQKPMQRMAELVEQRARIVK